MANVIDADPGTEPILLDLEQFCRRVSLSASTVRRLVKAGRIPFFQPAGKGGKLLFPSDALQQAGLSKASPPSAPPPSVRSGRQPGWMKSSHASRKEG